MDLSYLGYKAFTTSHNGLSNVLKTKVSVGFPFDPKVSQIPAHFEFEEAIWDTGASASVISNKVVQTVGLQPTGRTRIQTAKGMDERNTYLISIGLPNRVAIPEIKVAECDIGNIDVLIGMDIIAIGDFAVTNYQGKTIFSYRIPSSGKIDFVEDSNRKLIQQTGRNEPCPCGSGKKFKQCHLPLISPI